MFKIVCILLLSFSFNVFAETSYGAWDSPISAESILRGPKVARDMQQDGKSTYWIEPDSQGTSTIVRMDPYGKMQAVTPPNFNVQTRVHEYGGGAYTVGNGSVYASNGEDHSIYVFEEMRSPRRLTDGKTRFADLHISPYGLAGIGEAHESKENVKNFLALIDIRSGRYKALASGYDFYASPTISPDGRRIAWLCWNHPDMPWTRTELWMAEFDSSGNLTHPKQIAGFTPESIFEPQWSPDGTLYFVTDREKGWWNLHRYLNGTIENICPIEAETAEPLWTFGLSTYAFLGKDIIFTFNQKGTWHLAALDTKTKKITPIKQEGNYFHQIRSGPGYVRMLVQYPDKGEALLQIKKQGKNYTSTTLKSQPVFIDPGYISIPQHIAFPSQGRIAYGYYYAPKNKDYLSPSDEKPPLIVMIHGGPTAQAKNSLNLEYQFWTSHGFAILDVNYGGSTGYGREYRFLLDHEWGIVDVQDCVNGALYLVKKGYVDGDKLAIRGGSAGGYTALAALVFSDLFKAGASYYGVADILSLARDTHKFEKRYMEQLVGKYPEEKELWKERSPLFSANRITAPLIIFQGDQDPIVPKNQSIAIYEALKKRGVPTELHIYPGEAHGFRQAQHLIGSLTREAEFYKEIFQTKKYSHLEFVFPVELQ